MRDVYYYFSPSGAYCSYTAVLTIHEHTGLWMSVISSLKKYSGSHTGARSSSIPLPNKNICLAEWFYQVIHFFLWKSQILRWKDNEKHHCCILMFASRRCRAPEFGSSETAEHVRSLALLRAQVIPSSSANYLAGLLSPAPTKLTVFNSTSQLWKLHPNCASKLEINQPVSSRGPLLVSASSVSGSEHLLIHIVPSGLTSPYSSL